MANSVGGTSQNQTDNAVASTSKDKTLENSNSCSDLLSDKYKKYIPVDTPQITNINSKDLVNKIMSRMANANVSDDGKLKYVIFASIILYSDGKTYSNNYSGVDLSRDWGIINSFEKSYYCMKNGGSTLLPYAVFSSADKNIDMLISRYEKRMGTVITNSSGQLSPSIAEFWFLNRLPKDDSVQIADWDAMSTTDRDNIIGKVESSINLFNSVNV